MNDIDYLLLLLIIVGVFVIFEAGAIILKRWHTISYYSAHNRYLGYGIIGLFVLGGLSGGIWFAHHLTTLIPQ